MRVGCVPRLNKHATDFSEFAYIQVGDLHICHVNAIAQVSCRCIQPTYMHSSLPHQVPEAG